MKTGGLQHLPHPHIALNMPHPMHWLHEHQIAMIWLVAGLVFVLFAAIVFLAYSLGGSSGSADLLHAQPPYYPLY